MKWNVMGLYLTVRRYGTGWNGMEREVEWEMEWEKEREVKWEMECEVEWER